MRNVFGLVFAFAAFAFGLFLSYLIPFNAAAQDGLILASPAYGIAGLACGIEYLLCGLLIGLITTRRHGSYCRGEDLILATAFGVIALPALAVESVRDRRRVARRLANIASY